MVSITSVPAALRRLRTGAFVAAPLAAIAGTSLAVGWLICGWPKVDGWTLLLAAALVAAVVVGFQFPIPVGSHHEVEMSTLWVYLMITLLPNPALAASTAGAAMLIAELTVRKRRRSYHSDVITAASRWSIIALVAATPCHALGTSQQGLTYVLALVLMWVGDLLTFPLAMISMREEPLLPIVVNTIRETVISEGSQYAIGLLGALGASVHPGAVLLLPLPAAVVYVANKRAMELRSSTRQMLETMADAVDLRDSYTGGHSRRVAELTGKVLGYTGAFGPEMEIILAAARVHDIGKIGIPDDILNKPGPLTPEERTIIEAHPIRGAELLRRHRGFEEGRAIVRHHHENWDGTGYPDGLKKQEIPFGARVIAVADSFDAMTSDRPYRKAMSVRQALSVLRDGAGTQWDPAIVAAFLAVMIEEFGAPAVQPCQVVAVPTRVRPLASPALEPLVV